MYIFRDYSQLPPQQKGAVVAIGNFDGVHRGHRAVIARVREKARELGVPSAILTFEPHPRRFFDRASRPVRLLPFHHKARLLAQEGIDILYAQRFTGRFSQLNPEQFVEQVLIKGLGVHHLVTGEDFVFGHQRQGNAALLRKMSGESGAFTYESLPTAHDDGEKWSSSNIRAHIVRGEMDAAAAILGNPYHWIGRVIHGDARGRSLGFPTLNIKAPPVILPRHGVYVVRAGLHNENTRFDGVANFGLRPTFGGTQLRLEIHLFDREIDWYQKRIHVEFHAHLRDEQKFDSPEALRKQITQDCKEARLCLSQIQHQRP